MQELAGRLAGHIAGQLRSPFRGADPNVVEFPDGVHGLCAWALGVIIGALLLWATVTALASTRIGAVEAGPLANRAISYSISTGCSAPTADRATVICRRTAPRRRVSLDRGWAGAIWQETIVPISSDLWRGEPGLRLPMQKGASRK